MQDNSVRDGAASVATAESSVTSVRTTMRDSSRRDLDASTALMESFPVAALDAVAEAEIRAILERCAERRRALDGSPDDEARPFVAAELPMAEVVIRDVGYATPRRELRRPPPLSQPAVPPDHFLEPATEQHDSGESYRSNDSEMPWELLDKEDEMEAIEEAVASVRAARQIESTETESAIAVSLDGRGSGARGSSPTSRTPDGEGEPSKLEQQSRPPARIRAKAKK